MAKKLTGAYPKLALIVWDLTQGRIMKFNKLFFILAFGMTSFQLMADDDDEELIARGGAYRDESLENRENRSEDRGDNSQRQQSLENRQENSENRQENR